MAIDDGLTAAAQAEVDEYARTPRMNVGAVRAPIAEAHVAGAEGASAHLAKQKTIGVEVAANHRRE